MISRVIGGIKAAGKLKRCVSYMDLLKQPLLEADPEIHELIQRETLRQKESINLIASENYASIGALQAMGSVLNNKYSEGYPGARYYGGCEIIDEIELLAQKRALEAFNLDPEKWGVNLQALSGTPANLSIYYGVGGLGCKILGPELMHGGVGRFYLASQPRILHQEQTCVCHQRLLHLHTLPKRSCDRPMELRRDRVGMNCLTSAGGQIQA